MRLTNSDDQNIVKKSIHFYAIIHNSVEGTLSKLVAKGELKREGSGKNTCYYRLK